MTRSKLGWPVLPVLAAAAVVVATAGIAIGIHLSRSGETATAASEPGSSPVTSSPVSSSPVSSSPMNSRAVPVSPSASPSRATSRPRPAPTAIPKLTATPTTAPSSSAPVVVSTPKPTTSTPVGSYPEWLPFHTTMKVGCVKSNCENNYHGYWAIDFETLDNQAGAPVYAAGAGRVRIASQGSGNCGGPGTVENALIVEHGNGVESVYVHLHDFAVRPGSWVTPNTVIGHVGTSGYTDPCPDYHLHYELRINGASVNPGALKACHGSSLVTYPYAIGYADWNAIPPQEYAGGKLDLKGRTLYSTGTSCG